MTQAAQCDAVDFNGARCGLQVGHSGQHAPAIAAKQKTSFGRILVTPILVMFVAWLVGSFFSILLPAMAAGALLSIVYILWASRR